MQKRKNFSLRLRETRGKEVDAALQIMARNDGKRYYTTLPIRLTKEEYKAGAAVRPAKIFLERATLYFQLLQVQQKSFSPEDFSAFVLTGVLQESTPTTEKTITIRALMNEYISVNNLDYTTRKRYEKVARYAELLHPKATVLDLNFDFAARLTKYCRNELKNGNNTINKNLQALKALAKLAESKEFNVNRSFFRFNIPGTIPEKNRLSGAEVELLESYFHAGTFSGKLQSVAGAFLLACLTGLRYSDTQKLINESVLFQERFLSIRQKKGNKPFILKLSERALSVLQSPFMLPCTTNKNNNKLLPEILQKIDVARHITFHCARHTYACICLELGIPVEVVQRLLNHTDIRTTMIYAKSVDSAKNAAVDLWDKAKKQPD